MENLKGRNGDLWHFDLKTWLRYRKFCILLLSKNLMKRHYKDASDDLQHQNPVNWLKICFLIQTENVQNSGNTSAHVVPGRVLLDACGRFPSLLQSSKGMYASIINFILPLLVTVGTPVAGQHICTLLILYNIYPLISSALSTSLWHFEEFDIFAFHETLRLSLVGAPIW